MSANLCLFPEHPASDLAKARSVTGEVSELLRKAGHMEAEAEVLRGEADDLDEKARALRSRASALQACDGEAGRVELLESLLSDPREFADREAKRISGHPLLAPLRNVLAKLDAIIDDLDDSLAEKKVRLAMAPLKTLLHRRELAAMPERRAA